MSSPIIMDRMDDLATELTVLLILTALSFKCGLSKNGTKIFLVSFSSVTMVLFGYLALFSNEAALFHVVFK